MIYYIVMRKKKNAENVTENGEKIKKKRTKKQIILQIVAIVLITVAGIGAGFYSGMLYLSSKLPKIDYGAYDEASLKANAQEVIAANAGKSLSEVSAVDAFVIAQYNTQPSVLSVVVRCFIHGVIKIAGHHLTLRPRTTPRVRTRKAGGARGRGRRRGGLRPRQRRSQASSPGRGRRRRRAGRSAAARAGCRRRRRRSAPGR